MDGLSKNKNALNILFIVLLVAILLVGVALRVHAWLFSSQLYSDEGCLLSNAISRRFLGAFLPQDYGQCTPPIFLMLTKIFYSKFDLNEIALRFPVWLYSVLTVLLFVPLSLKIFKNKLSVLAAVFIIAFSPRLLYFTSILKQYTGDAFFTVAILLAGLWIKDKKFSNVSLVFCGIAAALCCFASYTAIFLIGILALCLFFRDLKNKNVNILSVVSFLLPFGALMTGFFFVNCLPTIQNQVLQDFWQKTTYCYTSYFFPTKIHQVMDYFRFFNCSGEIFKTGASGYTFYNIWLSAIAVVASLVIFFKNDRFKFFLFGAPFALAMILGFFHLYPFCPERIILYLLPIYVILLVKPLDYCDFGKKKLAVFLLIFYFCLINLGNIYSFSKEFLQTKEHIKVATARDFVRYLYNSDVKSDDYIFISTVNDVSFGLYDREKRFKPEQILVDNFVDIEPLNSVPTGKNVYFYRDEKYIDFGRISDWIKDNCEIIYKKSGDNYTIYKCRKVNNING